MAWIKSFSESRRDPNMIDFAAAIGLPVTQAIGLVDAFRNRVLEQSEIGDITSWSDPYICSAAGWETSPPGRFAAALKTHFTDTIKDRLVLRDWPIYAWPFLHSKYHKSKPKFLEEFARLYKSHPFFRYKTDPRATLGQPQGNPRVSPGKPQEDLIRLEESKTGSEVPGGSVVPVVKKLKPGTAYASAPPKKDEAGAEGGGDIFLKFPTKEGTEWPLTRAKLEEYGTTFPGLDVVRETRRAWQWAVDQPMGARKPREEIPAFITGWLNNEVKNGMGRRPHGPTEAGRATPNTPGKYSGIIPLTAVNAGDPPGAANGSGRS